MPSRTRLLARALDLESLHPVREGRRTPKSKELGGPPLHPTRGLQGPKNVVPGDLIHHFLDVQAFSEWTSEDPLTPARDRDIECAFDLSLPNRRARRPQGCPYQSVLELSDVARPPLRLQKISCGCGKILGLEPGLSR